MEHTPTPWHAPGIGEVCDQSGRVIAICIDCNPVEEAMRPDPALDEGEANARRIVACVNACRDIKTEVLEMETGSTALFSRIAGKLTSENMRLRDSVERLTAQRDELLAVLEAMLEEVAGCYCTTESAARAVIQKVRGGE